MQQFRWRTVIKSLADSRVAGTLKVDGRESGASIQAVCSPGERLGTVCMLLGMAQGALTVLPPAQLFPRGAGRYLASSPCPYKPIGIVFGGPGPDGKVRFDYGAFEQAPPWMWEEKARQAYARALGAQPPEAERAAPPAGTDPGRPAVPQPSAVRAEQAVEPGHVAEAMQAVAPAQAAEPEQAAEAMQAVAPKAPRPTPSGAPHAGVRPARRPCPPCTGGVAVSFAACASDQNPQRPLAPEMDYEAYCAELAASGGPSEAASDAARAVQSADERPLAPEMDYATYCAELAASGGPSEAAPDTARAVQSADERPLAPEMDYETYCAELAGAGVITRQVEDQPGYMTETLLGQGAKPPLLCTEPAAPDAGPGSTAGATMTAAEDTADTPALADVPDGTRAQASADASVPPRADAASVNPRQILTKMPGAEPCPGAGAWVADSQWVRLPHGVYGHMLLGATNSAVYWALPGAPGQQPPSLPEAVFHQLGRQGYWISPASLEEILA